MKKKTVEPKRTLETPAKLLNDFIQMRVAGLELIFHKDSKVQVRYRIEEKALDVWCVDAWKDTHKK